MTLVFDTCGLLWFTLDPSELSPRAHKAIQKSDRIIVSSISVWEIALKNQRRKVSLGMGLEEYVSRLEGASDFELMPVDHRDWLASALLKWPHRDPVDRLIVAIAERENATIITDDDAIKSYYKMCVS